MLSSVIGRTTKIYVNSEENKQHFCLLVTLLDRYIIKAM